MANDEAREAARHIESEATAARVAEYHRIAHALGHLQRLLLHPSTRELELVRTKVQEARFWLSESVKAEGLTTAYDQRAMEEESEWSAE